MKFAMAALAALVLAVPALASITVTNQTWKPPAGNWGHHDVVDVRIMQRTPRRDAIHLSGSGSIGRLNVEQHSGDAMKIHTDTNGVTIGSYAVNSVMRSLDSADRVHNDLVQAMGGRNVTFRGLFSEHVEGGFNFFFNQGNGGNGRPTDIVCEFCTLVGKRTDEGGRQVRIGNSLRCGIRHTLVVSMRFPLTITSRASSPVVVDSYTMTPAQWDAAGRPQHRDLWNADRSHKQLLDTLISQGKVRRLTT